jgi:4-diphosphocytidyl-2-C-methyl-D-erythritol kinase
VIRERAPGKVNLVLQVGPTRADGLHELCSLFASVELADTLTFEEHDAERDEVVCPGVDGPNLATAALAAFRRAAPGAALAPLRVTVEKRVPVAAGMGGGSADAAAALRAANTIAGEPLGSDALRSVAAEIGADVPSQVEPGHALVTGAGERVEPVALPDMALLLVPSRAGLSTADVYREADHIGATRERLDPERVRALAGAPLRELAAGVENDLERAALMLRPPLAETLAALRGTGALAAQITGSGPTAFGVFADRAEAEHAAALFSESIVTSLAQPGS